MRAALIFTLFLAAVTLGNAYSKYGRKCTDIGCASGEECVMAEDVCTLKNKGSCGTYPTCKKVSKTKRQTQGYYPYQPSNTQHGVPYQGQPVPTTLYPNINYQGGNAGYNQGTPYNPNPAYGPNGPLPGQYPSNAGAYGQPNYSGGSTAHVQQPYYPGGSGSAQTYPQPGQQGIPPYKPGMYGSSPVQTYPQPGYQGVPPHQPGVQGSYGAGSPQTYPQHGTSSNSDFYKQQTQQGGRRYRREVQNGYYSPSAPSYNNQPSNYNPQYPATTSANAYAHTTSRPVYHTTTARYYPNPYVTTRPTNNYYPVQNGYYGYAPPQGGGYYPSQNNQNGGYYPTQGGSRYPTQGGSRYPTQAYPQQYGNAYGGYQQPQYPQYSYPQYQQPTSQKQSSVWKTVSDFFSNIV